MATTRSDFLRGCLSFVVVFLVSFSPGLHGVPSHNVQERRLVLADPHIVGGRFAEIEDFPYQVSIETLLAHSCGGAIVSDLWVVTAAHCIHWRKTLPTFLKRIRAGSTRQIPIFENGGQIRYIAKADTHPKFNLDTIDYDVAVVRVSEKFQLGPRVQPISIPNVPENDFLDYKENFTVAGWGRTQNTNPWASMFLKTVNLTLSPRETCNEDVKPEDIISSRMLCVFIKGDGGPCNGDSGSALTHKGQLVGVASFLFSDTCNDPGVRNVFANLLDPEIRDYIRKFTEV